MMRLTSIEGDFLSRLSLESWTSPPVFDHGLLERMVREKYVTTQATGHGVHYEITDLGRTAVLKQAMPS
jgi:DNA-binding PadR family transcriptional regulator